MLTDVQIVIPVLSAIIGSVVTIMWQFYGEKNADKRQRASIGMALLAELSEIREQFCVELKKILAALNVKIA